MSNFTADQLIEAIRSADSLADLRRVIGPSDEQNAASKRRLDEMDRIWLRAGCSFDAMSPTQKDRYDKLMAEQSAYESEWC